MPTASSEEHVFEALDEFEIELPSWGFADTGTRFGTFYQAGAASTIGEKLRDAGMVHELTGTCPTVAVHVAWDFEHGIESVPEVGEAAREAGVAIGSINPTLFEDQNYKHGSLAHPDEAVRRRAREHILESIAIARETESRDVSCWFADGSNYPGTAHVRRRREHFREGLEETHEALGANQRLLIEYKPFEPAFYHTDVADWGMALRFAEMAGPQAEVLVDTGHHYQSQNIEQIVAWLLAEDRLGGFHFNDRRYADDDLTLGSIDPYQAFRIFHEIGFYRWETDENPDLAYMVDQSHNLKPKIEAMIQTVEQAQCLYAKAQLVDYEALRHHQEASNLVDAERCLKDAYETDVRGLVKGWRQKRGLPADPLTAYRESGYAERIAEERGSRAGSDRSGYT